MYSDADVKSVVMLLAGRGGFPQAQAAGVASARERARPECRYPL